jgi:hypothetical protein
VFHSFLGSQAANMFLWLTSLHFYKYRDVSHKHTFAAPLDWTYWIVLRLSLIASNTTHVSPNGNHNRWSFLNPPLGTFPEMARVRNAGQPTHPYGRYHYREGWWVINPYQRNGTISLNVNTKIIRSMCTYFKMQNSEKEIHWTFQ